MTEYDRGLIPVLVSMRTWGLKHLEHLDKIYGEDNKLKHLRKN